MVGPPKLLLCRVLPGNMQHFDKKLKKPPTGVHSNLGVDILAIFDNNQCYVEYVIDFGEESIEFFHVCVQCAVYSVVFSFQCSVFSVQCAMYSVQCAV